MENTYSEEVNLTLQEDAAVETECLYVGAML